MGLHPLHRTLGRIMRRLNRFCLTRQQIKMAWNARNCFNILQRKPLNERHLNLFQLEWKSKALCRLYFNGDVTEKIFKKTFNASHRNIYLTLAAMERRVDSIVFRSLFASSIFEARRMVSNCQILVNGKTVSRPGHSVSDGDVIQIAPPATPGVFKNARHPMIRLWSFIPSYLEVSYANLATVFLRSPKFEDIPSPYPRYMIENMAAFYSKRC